METKASVTSVADDSEEEDASSDDNLESKSVADAGGSDSAVATSC